MFFSRRDFLKNIAVAAAGSSVARVAGAATLLSFPYVQNVRQDRATIRWTMRDPGNGTVDFRGGDGQSGRLTSQVRAFLPQETGQDFAWYRHEVTLQNLKPATDYSYQVAMDGKPVTSDALHFTTAGVEPFQFVAFGDSGTGSPQQKVVLQQLLTRSPDFIIHVGDLVYPTGTYQRYETLYFDYYRDLMKNIPFFPCPGNHDYYEMSCIPYRALNSVPVETIPAGDAGRYYSFDWGNAHFVSLDSNDALADAASKQGLMLDWMDRDLAASTKFWKIVFFHHPAYSAGIHSDEEESVLIRQYVAPVIDKYRVDLVINGHEHSYQRTLPMRRGRVTDDNTGTIYVTTGGGGADLHPVGTAAFLKTAVSQFHYTQCDIDGAHLQFQSFTLDGDKLDDFKINPVPFLNTSGVVNSADFTPSVAPGALVSIFGLQLAPEEATYQKLPLPRALGGASVLVNGTPAPVLLATPKQINIQLPFTASGSSELTIQNPNGFVKTIIQVMPAAPAIFPNSLFHDNGIVVASNSPAVAGEYLTMYATGLGDTVQPSEAGVAGDAFPVRASVKVAIGQSLITPVFAGSVRAVPGVYSVRFQVPPPPPGSATIAIALVAGDVTSRTSLVAPMAVTAAG